MSLWTTTRWLISFFLFLVGLCCPYCISSLSNFFFLFFFVSLLFFTDDWLTCGLVTLRFFVSLMQTPSPAVVEPLGYFWPSSLAALCFWLKRTFYFFKRYLPKWDRNPFPCKDTYMGDVWVLLFVVRQMKHSWCKQKLIVSSFWIWYLAEKFVGIQSQLRKVWSNLFVLDNLQSSEMMKGEENKKGHISKGQEILNFRLPY